MELEPDDREGMERVSEACALLLPVAEQSVAFHGWDACVVRWLESLGSGVHEQLMQLRH